MEKRLLKVHAFGNLFYLYNTKFENEIDLGQLAKWLCSDKSHGDVDGLIIVSPSREADAKMDILNADGSTKDFCLNALRSVGRFVSEQLTKNEVEIETTMGSFLVKKATPIDDSIISYAVELYPISFDIKRFPMNYENKTTINNEIIKEFSPTIRFTAASVIHPHLIGIVDEHYIQICKHQLLLGEYLNDGKNEICTEGTNVSYVYKMENDTIFVRTYEKNIGFSNLCPTAMAAAALVAKRIGLVESDVVMVYNETGFVKCKAESDGEDKVTVIGDATVIALCEINVNEEGYTWQSYNETDELSHYQKSMGHVLSKTVSFHC